LVIQLAPFISTKHSGYFAQRHQLLFNSLKSRTLPSVSCDSSQQTSIIYCGVLNEPSQGRATVKAGSRRTVTAKARARS